ncbi:MAG: hypothetical protein LQ337_008544 [Flavoplaca oasis]|nr:MAG: hypothetical protein LQ337_008544 [Flavoplaca oasis]
MASFEDSPPPNKKRKIITTYGSQNVFSRALRAVKNVVPATLLSPESGAQHDGATQPSTTLKSQRGNTRLHSDSPKDSSSEKINGFYSPGKKRHNHECDDPSSNQRKPRASRRADDNDAETPESTSRKRRKHEAAAGAQNRKAPSGPARRVNGSVSSVPQSAEDAKRFWDELDGFEDPALEPARRASRHRNDEDQQLAEASPRPRTDLPGRPQQDESSSLRRSTRRDPNRVERPANTTSWKRRQHNLQPEPPPTSSDAEENEMGFRKITRDERPSSKKRSDLVGNETAESKPQSLSNIQADVGTNGKHPISRELLADPARHEHGHEVAMVGKLKPRSNDPNVPIPLQDDMLDIAADSEVSDQKLPKAMQKSTAKLNRVLETCPDDALALFKSQILDSFTRRHSPLVNFEDESRKLHQIVTQTVLAGEGNSILVIGPRGCGKTALVESVLSDLAFEHKDDFITIRLSGFIHTDDKLALREIWRQLGREVAAEDETTGIRTNYADTLTSLLALLAHSSEDDEHGNETARAVIFVIDEFDLFASHPRQTLLYNLFDVAQSRNAPVAVLGLTTRIDVVESLEKRVKSRFGQRYIHLSHPKSFNSFEALCRSALTRNEAVGKPFAKRVGNNNAVLQRLHAIWSDYVDALFTHDIQLGKFLRYLFAHSNCVASFQSSMLLSISLLGPSQIPTGESIIGSSLPLSDSKLQLLPSLSDLELSLLIAAARLDVILDTNVCNFKMVYDEYVQLASRVKLQSNAAGQTAVGGGARVWGKDVAKGAWERLMDLELILSASTAGSRSHSVGVMCRVDVALEEIGPNVPRMGATMSRWCKEI